MKENKEIKSTAHSKYRCQYHIVFAPLPVLFSLLFFLSDFEFFIS